MNLFILLNFDHTLSLGMCNIIGMLSVSADIGFKIIYRIYASTRYLPI